MFDTMYTTPEGFTLWRPLLMPDARSFADVLEYVREWDRAFMTGDAKNPPRESLSVEPRYIRQAGEVTAIMDAVGLNEVGPFCRSDLSQLGGLSHRSMAVRATDAAMEVVRGQIVTDDDHLSFKIIGHKSSGRALVILDHGHIIGSHWLAYIDPATIPAYPFKARDAAKARVCDEIRARGLEPFIARPSEPYQVKIRAFKREPYSAVMSRGNGYDFCGDPVTITAAGEVIR